MAFRWSLVRASAALAVALAAGHLAQAVRPADPAALIATASKDTVAPQSTMAVSVPKSASLRSGLVDQATDLSRITSVSADTAPAADCPASLGLTALPGAMIGLSLTAPCNRAERVVIRHAGLSFTARTGAEGTLHIQFPALQQTALVAVYLEGSAIVLGEVPVTDLGGLRRFALQWDSPALFDLRVAEGDRLFVGSAGQPADPLGQKIVSLGTASVTDPLLAEVYTYPAAATDVSLTVELRIDPETCGRTLNTQILALHSGRVEVRDYPVAVPLCGTSGDILVLKNLAPDLKLATPN
ncbi:hypothetical protein [Tabrizicola aquatica]|uniref:hypothetical protein n=1 Tax=Tabrizicola aquatica TaxID=909926 RepID=UPI0011AF5BE5|nr:hypothetical protein [Tabrizicola aquatica]